MKTPGIDALADALIGTCKSLSDALMVLALDELTQAECEELDSKALECTQCGWWFPAEDTTVSPGGEVVCLECAEDIENG